MSTVIAMVPGYVKLVFELLHHGWYSRRLSRTKLGSYAQAPFSLPYRQKQTRARFNDAALRLRVELCL